MSLHKLTAGDGYTYLTRQVAAQDATHRGYDGLGDYYSQRGESPGVWMGRGADGLPGFPAGPQVSEAQMVALFGEGRHPDAAAIEAAMVAAGHDVPAVLAATRLGSPYRVERDVPEFRRQLAEHFEAWNSQAGLPRDWPVPEAERARIRTELGRELFTAQFGRPPLDARELSGFVARASRQQTTAVAGYDLTFTPVKSVSALWAVAPRADAQVIEQAHAQVVAETLAWVEDHAGYSRLGRNGVRQVQVRGLIAAAFTHRDSRAGDPNLHTHVALSNKVQVAGGVQDGQWVALDGRPLHKLAVAASERYNTRLEALLTDRLGMAFAERPGAEPGKRAVREIVGVDGRLSTTWSARRAAIDVRRAELAARFQADHGRPPGPVEAVKLAQRATLETRQAKHDPRTHAEQRTVWREQALAVLGGPQALAAMLREVGRRPGRAEQRPVAVTPAWVTGTAETVLAVVQSSRATWQEAHVRAETERQVRTASLPLGQVDAAVERIVAAALSPASSLPLGMPEPVSEPAALRRTDGSSMYASAGMQLYTSPSVVAAERALIATAARTDGRTTSPAAVDLAIAESAARGVALNPGQAALVRELATSGRRLQLALAPAGTGKTTAMAVLARAWTGDGGSVLGLAPSAAAAAALGGDLNAPTDTLAKLLHSLDALEQDDAARPAASARVPHWVRQIGPGTLVVVDEAGMAGTGELARAVAFVVARGGSVRLVGDDSQLAAVGAGGVLRDLADTAGALTLSQVVRFTDPAEGAASLALRAGEVAAIGFYIDHGRVHVGDPGTVVDQAYTAWSADRATGLDALMLAPTRDIAAQLNARARADRLAATRPPAGPDGTPGEVPGAAGQGREVQLADGSAASAGDTIVTRRNDRRLATSATDWVKNGDRWTVDQVLAGGALQVTHLATRRRVNLPAAYAAEHVALGYASTVHAAQGTTTGVCHTVAAGAESRQLLYVAMTRGRAANHLYLTAVGDGDEHTVITPDALLPPTAVDLLGRVLARDGAQSSATTAQRQLADPAVRLHAGAARFYDSLHVAAQTHLGADRMAAIDVAADAALPGLTANPAWPTLRAHLALLEVDGHDAAQALSAAISRREMGTALDPAAVLDWRLDPTGDHSAGPSTGSTGPLPWLPAVPAGLAADPTWGGYLAGRDRHTQDVAAQVAARAGAWTPTSAPAWAHPLVRSRAANSVASDQDRARTELLVSLAVWRAAQGVDDTDLRPTGPPRLPAAEQRAQKQLNQAVQAALGDPAGTSHRWKALAEQIEPRLLHDAFWPQLADRLAAADRAGIDITTLARTAGALKPLPDELPAAALWWRLSRHLSPAALQATDSDTVARNGGGTASTLRPPWTPVLADLIGPDAARQVLADPAWPALVAAVTDATGNGWTPEQVLTTAYELLGGQDDSADRALRVGELATALVWRIGMLADPEPIDTSGTWDPTDPNAPPIPPDPAELDLQPPDDLYDDPDPPAPSPPDPASEVPHTDVDTDWLAGLVEPPVDQPDAPYDPPSDDDIDGDGHADHHVDAVPVQGAGQERAADEHGQLAAPGGIDVSAPGQQRDLFGAEQPPPQAGSRPLAAAAPGSAVPAERLLELNEQALAFFAAAYRGSWAAAHLRERLGTDLTDDPRFTPGYAPASWTGLTDHLRALGATDSELLAAGLATQARTGRLIDRFRDRLVLPIQTGDSQTIAFIGRRNPATDDAGPKYLNTGDTVLYSKGAQLYGMAETAAELAGGATPVLVEGPLDAIAVTLAGDGTAVGVAPLGTAFTDAQADTLRPYLGPGRPGVVVATDGDEPGQKAAVRAYWQLTARGGNPRHLVMPDGHDPASLLQTAGPAALRQALADPPTLARTLIDARVAQFAHRMRDVEGPLLAVRAAADAIGALPPEHWLDHINYLDSIVPTAPGESHLAVLDAGHAWITNLEELTRQHLTDRHIPHAPGTTPPPPAAAAPPAGSEGRGDPHDAAVRAGADSDEAARPPTGQVPAPPAPQPLREPEPTLVEQWAADAWVDFGRSIDPQLVAGADWSGLAAALDRASHAGYDVQQHLPRLAAQSPLPQTRPARALHYRLVQECTAAITPLPPRLQHTDNQQRAAAALARLDAEADRHDNRPSPAGHPTPPGRPGPLEAARARMHSEARRRDDQQAHTAPTSPRPPSSGPTAAPRPRADRPARDTQRPGPRR